MYFKRFFYYLCLIFTLGSNAKSLPKDNIAQEHIVTVFHSVIEGQQSVNLRAMQAGRIISLSLLNGSVINEGDIIAEVYSPEWADNWHQAKAQHKEKEVSLTYAKKEWQRAKNLHQKDLLAIAKIDEAENHYLAAKASLSVAKSQVSSSYKRYQERLIRAPFSGLVSQLNVRRGDYLNEGQSVLVLNEVNRQKARFNLSQHHIIGLSLGQKLTLTIPVIDKQQQVVITEISRPTPDASRLFEVTVALSETQEEFIGLQVALSIESVADSYSVQQSKLHFDLAGGAYIFSDNEQSKIAVNVVAIKEKNVLLRAASAKVDLAICCKTRFITSNSKLLALSEVNIARGMR